MLSSTTAAGRVVVITAGRYGSSTSSTPTSAFGSAASAAVSPAGMFAPPSLLTTAPLVRRAAVSRVRVVLFPFVPLTRISRRPAAARRSANGSTASMTRPPMVVPPPAPVSRDRAAAADPRPRATANRVPPGGIAVAPYLSLTRVQHFGTTEPWPKAPPGHRLTGPSRPGESHGPAASSAEPVEPAGANLRFVGQSRLRIDVPPYRWVCCWSPQAGGFW